MNLRSLPVIAVALVTLGACGGSSDDATTATIASSVDAADGAAAPADEHVVTISSSRFDRLELRIAPGETVTFVNTDAFDHTVTSRDDSPVEFDSGDLGQDETFEFTFDEPGEYAYFCRIHPTMRAVVIVE